MKTSTRRILWVSGSRAESSMGLSVSESLRKRNIDTVFLTNLKETHKYLQSANVQVILLSEISKKHFRQFNQEELHKMESYFLFPGFNMLKRADGTLRDLGLREAYDIIASYYLACKELFDAFNFSALVMYPTAMVAGRIPYSVASSLGVNTLILQWGPLHQKTFVVEDMGEDWMWSELLDEEADFKNDLAVDEAIRIVVHDDQTAVYPASRSRLRRFLGILSLFKEYVFFTAGCFDFDSSLLRFEINKEIDFLRGSLTRPFAGYEAPKPSERFVFFPMHAHFDAALLSANPLFESQIEFADVLARCLPVGYMLYVKEHPYDVGHLRRKDVLRLKALGNVRVIDPWTKSISLCRNAHAVVVFSGSVGWEAFCLRKPVIALGKPFYSYCDLVYSVRSFTALKDIVWMALAQGERIYDDRYPEYLAFFSRVLRTVRLGNVQGYKSNFGWDEEKGEANIEAIASAIHEKIQNSMPTGKQVTRRGGG